MIEQNKNTACQSLAIEQAVFQIRGGAICPSSELILKDVEENATTSFFSTNRAKIRNFFKFKNDHETKAISLIRRINNRKKLLSTSVIKNINIYNLKNYNIPTWRELNRIDKTLGICCFVVNQRDYLSFSLRFSQEFISRAYRSKRDLTSYISDRLSQNFKNNGNITPKYMFTIEYDNKIDDDKSFHIHGIIEKDIKNLTHILKATALGPKYKKHSMNRYVLRLDVMTNPLGWIQYITKHKVKAYSLIYISRSLNQKFKSFYNLIKNLN